MIRQPQTCLETRLVCPGVWLMKERLAKDLKLSAAEKEEKTSIKVGV